MVSQSENFSRTKQMREMRERGLSYQAIGNIFGISRIRVSQVLFRNELRHIIDKRVRKGEITREQVSESLSRKIFTLTNHSFLLFFFSPSSIYQVSSDTTPHREPAPSALLAYLSPGRQRCRRGRRVRIPG